MVLDKEYYAEANIDHELQKIDKTIYQSWYDYTGGEAHSKVCRLKGQKGCDIRKMFKSKYAEQEEQDRIDKLAAYHTGDIKGEVGTDPWSDDVNIEEAVNSLDQARQEAWVIAAEDMESFQEGKGRGSEHGGRSHRTSGQELERGDCGAPRDGGRNDWANDQEMDRDDAVLD